MTNYSKRVPFGAERKLCQPADSQNCSVCNCRVGEPHVEGCEAEECPVCQKVLIGCCCEALSRYDGERIIASLYKRFSDLESALQVVGGESCGVGSASYMTHAVMRYIFEHVPEEARAEITRVFRLRFPGLIPQLQDDDGRGYYTAEQLAEALDVPVQEVNERIEAMIAAGDGVATSSGRKLRKVH